LSVLEENEKTVERLEKFLGPENVVETRVPRPRRAFVTMKLDKLREAVKYLRDEEGLKHISTISGVDLGGELEVVYHLRKKDLSLSLKVTVPADDPVVPSITDILNGATLYEREIHDLLGIVPEGHPNLERLILPDDWPEGVHPLRKEWDVQSLRERVDGERWGRNE